MQCGTSFYNLTLGKQLTARFWPLAALYTLVLAILLPLRGLTVQVMSHAIEAEYYAVSEAKAVFYILTPWGALLAGGIAAMVVCSHLYSTRSANFTAALGPKRTALFCTHYLTGLLWLVVPFLLMGFSTLAIYLTKVPNSTDLVWQVFGSGIAVGTVALVLFYSFGVLCGMLTGHLLALPVFYLTFNFLVAGVWYLLTLLFQTFYYGYPGSLTQVPDWVLWLSPALRMSQGLMLFPEVTFVVYGVVGVVMALVAWLLYVKRPMERAGDVVAWAGLRPVFRYGVAICAGLALGSLTRLVLSLGELGLAVSVLLWGVAGCFVAQMLLTKSVRVLRYWKGAVAVAVTFAALFVVMALDLTGYETRVPDGEQVASVEIGQLYSYPSDSAGHLRGAKSTDPQTIQLAIQLHQLLVDQPVDASTFDSRFEDRLQRMDLTYTLTDGTRLSRFYFVPLLERDIDREGSTTYLTNQLINRPDLLLDAYRLDEVEKLEAQGYRLRSGYVEGVREEFSGSYLSLSADEARTVYLALLQDIQEGNLTRDLFQDVGWAYITLTWEKPTDTLNPYFSSSTDSFSLSITDDAAHTLEALEGLSS